MKKILFVALLFSFSLVSDPVFYKPEKLTSRRGEWVHKETQRYYDYLYNDKVVFRIAEKMLPAINNLIAYAIDYGGKLKHSDHTEIFHVSGISIRKNFSVSFEDSDLLIVDPKALILTKEPGKSAGKVKCYAKFSSDSAPLKIWAKAYRMLALWKIKAITQQQFLGINIDALDEISVAALTNKKIITLVPQLHNIKN